MAGIESMSDKDWRVVERLAESFERVLSPQGAVIKSPDSLPDRITGESKDIDVSIRYTVGSIHLLLVVECRDRARVDDCTWIEQLATRSKDVGANATVAVSPFPVVALVRLPN
jgi:hypothetical protein